MVRRGKRGICGPKNSSQRIAQRRPLLGMLNSSRNQLRTAAGDHRRRHIRSGHIFRKTPAIFSGTGRRADSGTILRDVTKTKPSHYRAANKAAAEAKSNWPSTFEAVTLANEVKASGLSEEAKARLIREIVEYEGTHGKSTQTFAKKVRRQIRPPQK